MRVFWLVFAAVLAGLVIVAAVTVQPWPGWARVVGAAAALALEAALLADLLRRPPRPGRHPHSSGES